MRGEGSKIDPPCFFSWKMAGGVTLRFFSWFLSIAGGYPVQGYPVQGGYPTLPTARPRPPTETTGEVPAPRSQSPSCLISLIYVIKQTPDGKR